MSGQHVTIDEAMSDPALLGSVLGDPATWATWRTTLRAAFGVPLADAEREVFADIAGGRTPPQRRVQQLWAIVGRRGGKTRMAALACCYFATCIDWRGVLAPGETGHVLCLAPTQRQAQGVLGYCRAMLEASPVLSQQIESVAAEEIRLNGNIVISTHAANYRTVRGRSLLAVVLDESALFRSEESAQPDIEILRACVPGLLTTKGMALGISTPYGMRGLLFEKYRDHFGKDGDEVLVVKGGSTTFNPTLDQAQIDKELAADPEANRAEYLSEFRSDLSAYVDRETLLRCVEVDRRERPYIRAYRYTAFADPSGGQHDSFCLGISHREGERTVLDAALEWKAPFDSAEVIADTVKVLRTYHCNVVNGDRYAANFVSSEYRDHGISYRPTDRDKSQIFIDALPLLTSGNAALLDMPRLVSQITQLQRETGKSGRDRVVKMRGAYDDLANAALGSMVYALEGSKRPRASQSFMVESCSGAYQAI